MELRGVPKIVDDLPSTMELTEELDANRVREFVTVVFQRKGLPPPYTIEFTQGRGTKPLAYFQDECLYVTASTDSELKRLIGRFAIESTWSRREWLLATKAGRFSVAVGFLMMALTVIAAVIAVLPLEMGYWIVVIITSVVTGIALWSSYQVAFKSYVLRQNLVLQMADLECMSEYDGKDYEEDRSLVVHSSTILTLLAGILVLGMAVTFYIDDILPMAIEFGLLVFAALVFLFGSSWKTIGTNLCYGETGFEDDEEEDEYEDSEYLTAAYTEVIERMNLWESLKASHELDFREIRGRFFEVRYPQCRWANDYVEDEILFIDATDISEDAAKRLGAAQLAKASLRYYRELSFTRRAIMLVAFFFGLCMLMVLLIAGSIFGPVAGIVTTVITCVVFSGLWHVGWKQNEEVRRDLPQALKRTEVFNDYELAFYRNYMYSISSRFDLAFVAGFNLILVALAALILFLTFTNI